MWGDWNILSPVKHGQAEVVAPSFLMLADLSKKGVDWGKALAACIVGCTTLLLEMEENQRLWFNKSRAAKGTAWRMEVEKGCTGLPGMADSRRTEDKEKAQELGNSLPYQRQKIIRSAGDPAQWVERPAEHDPEGESLAPQGLTTSQIIFSSRGPQNRGRKNKKKE